MTRGNYVKLSLVTFSIATLLLCNLVSTSQVTFRKTYGGLGEEKAAEVLHTIDNAYICLGSTGSFGNGSTDIYLFKTDTGGNMLWSKTYGGANADIGTGIEQLPDSGYIISGYTNSFGSGGYDMYLIRIDSVGNTLWTNTYGGSDWDFAYDLVHTSDNGFILVGESYSFGAGPTDIFIVKTDSNGVEEWYQTYGGDSTDIAYSIIESIENEFYVIGSTKSFGLGKEDVYLLRLDNAGDTIWTRTYGGSQADIGLDIVQSIDSNITFAGSTNSFGVGLKGAYICKLDELTGDSIWLKKYGGLSGDEEAYSIGTTWDNRLIICGYTTSTGSGMKDYYLLKLTTNGIYLFARTFGDLQDDIAYSVDTIGSEYILAGITESYGVGLHDVWLIKTDFDGMTAFDTVTVINDILIITPISNQDHITIFPNPANNVLYLNTNVFTGTDLTIKLFDLLGRLVYSNEMQIQNEIKIDVSSINPGYHILVINDNFGTLRSVNVVIN